MNPGRSTVTLTVVICSGMPCRIEGNGPLVIVICEVWGSTLIAERTTTVPRLNGPASAKTTTESPNGAPLYGPVRYTGSRGLPACGTNTGSGPGPAPTVTCPISLAAGHVPSLACGS